KTILVPKSIIRVAVWPRHNTKNSRQIRQCRRLPMNEAAPIILVHGLFGFNQLTFGGLKVAEYFRSIPEALRRDGHSVPDPPKLNPGGSVAERAQDLKNYLEDPNRGDVFGKQVHLIGHSLGG